MIDPELKRDLRSLYTLYNLEPTLKDIYVEGPRDRTIIKWFLDSMGCKDFKIYPIDLVDIPKDYLNARGLDNGNRGRIIELSLLFDEHLINKIQRLTCVADSDFNFLFGSKFKSPYLVFTNYCNMDCYLWNTDCVSRVLVLGLNLKNVNLTQLISDCEVTLKSLFLIRATNESLGWNCKWIKFTSECQVTPSGLKFNHQKYINKYLKINGKAKEKTIFDKTMKSLQSKNIPDTRCTMRGRDIFDLMGWYVAKKINKDSHKFRSGDILKQMFYSTLILPNFKKIPMFQLLYNRYK